ncbi:F510_1955 family glycosylhydrolase [Paenibacillus chungangensis]|uniref:F510_1955 family glycosylhydrolase n=1 Tax=Paenibacillus chungangensis TaxID=696535 RepID=A0ABW3HQ98_9BACL
MKKKRRLTGALWWGGTLVIGLTIGIYAFIINESEEKQEQILITHIHGMGYKNDGSELMLAAHDGIKVYADGKWRSGEGDSHDYMGFNVVDNGFYSSGHPSLTSALSNPLGIVRSTDDGKSLGILDLHGVEDFHGLAVGYESYAIYAYNPKPNDRMKSAGLYVSTDDARTWRLSRMEGIAGNMLAIAAHPSLEEEVAISTDTGIYVSSDYGDSFTRLDDRSDATALAYGIDGELWTGGDWLYMLHQGEIVSVKTPPLASDESILYIARNPQNRSDIAISTERNNIFLTGNGGEDWELIAEEGESVGKIE